MRHAAISDANCNFLFEKSKNLWYTCQEFERVYASEQQENGLKTFDIWFEKSLKNLCSLFEKKFEAPIKFVENKIFLDRD